MRTAACTPPAQDIIDTEAAWMDALAAPYIAQLEAIAEQAP